MVDQTVLGGPADVDRLFERVEHELRARGLARPPADDTPGEHVDDERHVDHARPGRDAGTAVEGAAYRGGCRSLSELSERTTRR